MSDQVTANIAGVAAAAVVNGGGVAARAVLPDQLRGVPVTNGDDAIKQRAMNGKVAADAGGIAAAAANLLATEQGSGCPIDAGGNAEYGGGNEATGYVDDDGAGTDIAGPASLPPSEGRPPLDTIGSDGGGPSSVAGVMVGPPSPLTGCYLLIVVGEPHSEEHKDIILQHLLKGFLSWDVSDCHVDLEEELNTITQHAPEGEEARYGERLIQYASENLVTEVLIHPQYNTLIQCMRNLLSSFTRHRQIIHAGYTFSGNGSWILQDGTFSAADFSEAFQEHDVQRVIRAYADTISMNIHCADSGLWSALPEKSFARFCKIRINPVDVLDMGSESINAFIDYLSPMIAPTSLQGLLETSDVVGNIRFTHPTLYVFPGGQGDAALFGINGFNMLVDGGFNRKACFWDFARHLDRLDAVLMTRLNNSNIQGIGSVLERKRDAFVYPQIGHFFCNIPDRKGGLASPDGDKDRNPLLIDLLERGHNLISDLKSLDLKPQACYRTQEPINLYHKVGHGTLDMYVISPSRDSREVKEFLQKWNSNDQRLFSARDTREFTIPIQNIISICALLVWQPANPDDTITRILFPGSTPDFKIQEGLEKLKHLEFMKYSSCTAKSISPIIQTVTTTRKTYKSTVCPGEPSIPSKPSKFAHVAATTIATQQDNKIKEAAEEMRTEKTTLEKGLTKQRKEDFLDMGETAVEGVEEITADEAEIEIKEGEKPETVIIEEIKDSTETKVELVIVKAQIEREKAKEEIEIISDIAKPTQKLQKIKAEKPRAEVKPVVRSRIDTKPPKSMDRKPGKKDLSAEKKSSPSATPRKQESIGAKHILREREAKSKVSPRAQTKSSPSSTPAKSAKDANNRKVLESKHISRQQQAVTAKRREATKSTGTASSEKREVKVQQPQQRRPISRRPRASSPTKRAPGSPIKYMKPKADLKKSRLDKGGTTDSSLVSTPSAADEISAIRKIQDMVSAEEFDADKQRELDDLKEEQEVVREIEAVFNRDEKKRQKRRQEEQREVFKQDSTTEAEEEDEYLIIEKEEIEQYTEDSVVEQESSVTKEEEMQKHQRDSQESEKKRKKSAEEEIEAAIAKAEAEDRKSRTQADSFTHEVVTVSEEEFVRSDDERIKKLTSSQRSDIREEVQGIITTAKDIVTSHTQESIYKREEELSSPTPDEKLSSTKKTSDTKDDMVIEPEAGPANLQENLQFSTTIESGATTAPTLPEDERIPLDDIKEDLVIEEKHVKEETKEFEPTREPRDVTGGIPPQPTIDRVLPQMKMTFEAQQNLMRDVIKTPDEVADLPVHEEADFGEYEIKESQESEKILSHKEEIATEEKEIEEKGDDKISITIKEDELAEKISKREDKLTIELCEDHLHEPKKTMMPDETLSKVDVSYVPERTESLQQVRKSETTPEEKEQSEITSEDDIPAQEITVPPITKMKEREITTSVESPATIEEAIEVEVKKSPELNLPLDSQSELRPEEKVTRLPEDILSPGAIIQENEKSVVKSSPATEKSTEVAEDVSKPESIIVEKEQAKPITTVTKRVKDEKSPQTCKKSISDEEQKTGSLLSTPESKRDDESEKSGEKSEVALKSETEVHEKEQKDIEGFISESMQAEKLITIAKEPSHVAEPPSKAGEKSEEAPKAEPVIDEQEEKYSVTPAVERDDILSTATEVPSPATSVNYKSPDKDVLKTESIDEEKVERESTPSVTETTKDEKQVQEGKESIADKIEQQESLPSLPQSNKDEKSIPIVKEQLYIPSAHGETSQELQEASRPESVTDEKDHQDSIAYTVECKEDEKFPMVAKERPSTASIIKKSPEASKSVLSPEVIAAEKEQREPLTEITGSISDEKSPGVREKSTTEEKDTPILLPPVAESKRDDKSPAISKESLPTSSTSGEKSEYTSKLEFEVDEQETKVPTASSPESTKSEKSTLIDNEPSLSPSEAGRKSKEGSRAESVLGEQERKYSAESVAETRKDEISPSKATSSITSIIDKSPEASKSAPRTGSISDERIQLKPEPEVPETARDEKPHPDSKAFGADEKQQQDSLPSVAQSKKDEKSTPTIKEPPPAPSLAGEKSEEVSTPESVADEQETDSESKKDEKSPMAIIGRSPVEYNDVSKPESIIEEKQQREPKTAVTESMREEKSPQISMKSTTDETPKPESSPLFIENKRDDTSPTIAEKPSLALSVADKKSEDTSKPESVVDEQERRDTDTSMSESVKSDISKSPASSVGEETSEHAPHPESAVDEQERKHSEVSIAEGKRDGRPSAVIKALSPPPAAIEKSLDASEDVSRTEYIVDEKEQPEPKAEVSVTMKGERSIREIKESITEQKQEEQLPCVPQRKNDDKSTAIVDDLSPISSVDDEKSIQTTQPESAGEEKERKDSVASTIESKEDQESSMVSKKRSSIASLIGISPEPSKEISIPESFADEKEQRKPEAPATESKKDEKAIHASTKSTAEEKQKPESLPLVAENKEDGMSPTIAKETLLTPSAGEKSEDALKSEIVEDKQERKDSIASAVESKIDDAKRAPSPVTSVTDKSPETCTDVPRDESIVDEKEQSEQKTAFSETMKDEKPLQDRKESIADKKRDEESLPCIPQSEKDEKSTTIVKEETPIPPVADEKSKKPKTKPKTVMDERGEKDSVAFTTESKDSKESSTVANEQREKISSVTEIMEDEKVPHVRMSTVEEKLEQKPSPSVAQSKGEDILPTISKKPLLTPPSGEKSEDVLMPQSVVDEPERKDSLTFAAESKIDETSTASKASSPVTSVVDKSPEGSTDVSRAESIVDEKEHLKPTAVVTETTKDEKLSQISKTSVAVEKQQQEPLPSVGESKKDEESTAFVKETSPTPFADGASGQKTPSPEYLENEQERKHSVASTVENKDEKSPTVTKKLSPVFSEFGTSPSASEDVSRPEIIADEKQQREPTTKVDEDVKEGKSRDSEKSSVEEIQKPDSLPLVAESKGDGKSPTIAKETLLTVPAGEESENALRSEFVEDEQERKDSVLSDVESKIDVLSTARSPSPVTSVIDKSPEGSTDVSRPIIDEKDQSEPKAAITDTIKDGKPIQISKTPIGVEKQQQVPSVGGSKEDEKLTTFVKKPSPVPLADGEKSEKIPSPESLENEQERKHSVASTVESKDKKSSTVTKELPPVVPEIVKSAVASEDVSKPEYIADKKQQGESTTTVAEDVKEGKTLQVSKKSSTEETQKPESLSSVADNKRDDKSPTLAENLLPTPTAGEKSESTLKSESVMNEQEREDPVTSMSEIMEAKKLTTISKKSSPDTSVAGEKSDAASVSEFVAHEQEIKYSTTSVSEIRKDESSTASKESSPDTSTSDKSPDASRDVSKSGSIADKKEQWEPKSAVTESLKDKKPPQDSKELIADEKQQQESYVTQSEKDEKSTTTVKKQSPIPSVADEEFKKVTQLESTVGEIGRKDSVAGTEEIKEAESSTITKEHSLIASMVGKSPDTSMDLSRPDSTSDEREQQEPRTPVTESTKHEKSPQASEKSTDIEKLQPESLASVAESKRDDKSHVTAEEPLPAFPTGEKSEDALMSESTVDEQERKDSLTSAEIKIDETTTASKAPSPVTSVIDKSPEPSEDVSKAEPIVDENAQRDQSPAVPETLKDEKQLQDSKVSIAGGKQQQESLPCESPITKGEKYIAIIKDHSSVPSVADEESKEASQKEFTAKDDGISSTVTKERSTVAAMTGISPEPSKEISIPESFADEKEQRKPETPATESKKDEKAIHASTKSTAEEKQKPESLPLVAENKEDGMSPTIAKETLLTPPAGEKSEDALKSEIVEDKQERKDSIASAVESKIDDAKRAPSPVTSVTDKSPETCTDVPRDESIVDEKEQSEQKTAFSETMKDEKPLQDRKESTADKKRDEESLPCIPQSEKDKKSTTIVKEESSIPPVADEKSKKPEPKTVMDERGEKDSVAFTTESKDSKESSTVANEQREKISSVTEIMEDEKVPHVRKSTVEEKLEQKPSPSVSQSKGEDMLPTISKKPLLTPPSGEKSEDVLMPQSVVDEPERKDSLTFAAERKIDEMSTASKAFSSVTSVVDKSPEGSTDMSRAERIVDEKEHLKPTAVVTEITKDEKLSQISKTSVAVEKQQQEPLPSVGESKKDEGSTTFVKETSPIPFADGASGQKTPSPESLENEQERKHSVASTVESKDEESSTVTKELSPVVPEIGKSAVASEDVSKPEYIADKKQQGESTTTVAEDVKEGKTLQVSKKSSTEETQKPESLSSVADSKRDDKSPTIAENLLPTPTAGEKSESTLKSESVMNEQEREDPVTSMSEIMEAKKLTTISKKSSPDTSVAGEKSDAASVSELDAHEQERKYSTTSVSEIRKVESSTASKESSPDTSTSDKSPDASRDVSKSGSIADKKEQWEPKSAVTESLKDKKPPQDSKEIIADEKQQQESYVTQSEKDEKSTTTVKKQSPIPSVADEEFKKVTQLESTVGEIGRKDSVAGTEEIKEAESSTITKEHSLIASMVGKSPDTSMDLSRPDSTSDEREQQEPRTPVTESTKHEKSPQASEKSTDIEKLQPESLESVAESKRDDKSHVTAEEPLPAFPTGEKSEDALMSESTVDEQERKDSLTSAEIKIDETTTASKAPSPVTSVIDKSPEPSEDVSRAGPIVDENAQRDQSPAVPETLKDEKQLQDSKVSIAGGKQQQESLPCESPITKGEKYIAIIKDHPSILSVADEESKEASQKEFTAKDDGISSAVTKERSTVAAMTGKSPEPPKDLSMSEIFSYEKGERKPTTPVSENKTDEKAPHVGKMSSAEEKLKKTETLPSVAESKGDGKSSTMAEEPCLTPPASEKSEDALKSEIVEDKQERKDSIASAVESKIDDAKRAPSPVTSVTDKSPETCTDVPRDESIVDEKEQSEQKTAFSETMKDEKPLQDRKESTADKKRDEESLPCIPQSEKDKKSTTIVKEESSIPPVADEKSKKPEPKTVMDERGEKDSVAFTIESKDGKESSTVANEQREKISPVTEIMEDEKVPHVRMSTVEEKLEQKPSPSVAQSKGEDMLPTISKKPLLTPPSGEKSEDVLMPQSVVDEPERKDSLTFAAESKIDETSTASKASSPVTSVVDKSPEASTDVSRAESIVDEKEHLKPTAVVTETTKDEKLSGLPSVGESKKDEESTAFVKETSPTPFADGASGQKTPSPESLENEQERKHSVASTVENKDEKSPTVTKKLSPVFSEFGTSPSASEDVSRPEIIADEKQQREPTTKVDEDVKEGKSRDSEKSSAEEIQKPDSLPLVAESKGDGKSPTIAKETLLTVPAGEESENALRSEFVEDEQERKDSVLSDVESKIDVLSTARSPSPVTSVIDKSPEGSTDVSRPIIDEKDQSEPKAAITDTIKDGKPIQISKTPIGVEKQQQVPSVGGSKEDEKLTTFVKKPSPVPLADGEKSEKIPSPESLENEQERKHSVASTVESKDKKSPTVSKKLSPVFSEFGMSPSASEDASRPESIADEKQQAKTTAAVTKTMKDAKQTQEITISPTIEYFDDEKRQQESLTNVAKSDKDENATGISKEQPPVTSVGSEKLKEESPPELVADERERKDSVASAAESKKDKKYHTGTGEPPSVASVIEVSPEASKDLLRPGSIVDEKEHQQSLIVVTESVRDETSPQVGTKTTAEENQIAKSSLVTESKRDDKPPTVAKEPLITPTEVDEKSEDASKPESVVYEEERKESAEEKKDLIAIVKKPSGDRTPSVSGEKTEDGSRPETVVEEKEQKDPVASVAESKEDEKYTATKAPSPVTSIIGKSPKASMDMSKSESMVDKKEQRELTSAVSETTKVEKSPRGSEESITDKKQKQESLPSMAESNKDEKSSTTVKELLSSPSADGEIPEEASRPEPVADEKDEQDSIASTVKSEEDENAPTEPKEPHSTASIIGKSPEATKHTSTSETLSDEKVQRESLTPVTESMRDERSPHVSKTSIAEEKQKPESLHSMTESKRDDKSPTALQEATSVIEISEAVIADKAAPDQRSSVIPQKMSRTMPEKGQREISSFSTELRETHITVIESPEFKVALHEKDEIILHDIKEEEEEHRTSPPTEEPSLLPVQLVRPVSPREEEVAKIVVNVAHVLKSEKPISEIIPDFDEKKLEEKLKAVEDPHFTEKLLETGMKRKDSRYETESEKSSPDLKSGPISIEEKDKVELSEKVQFTEKSFELEKKMEKDLTQKDDKVTYTDYEEFDGILSSGVEKDRSRTKTESAESYSHKVIKELMDKSAKISDELESISTTKTSTVIKESVTEFIPKTSTTTTTTITRKGLEDEVGKEVTSKGFPESKESEITPKKSQGQIDVKDISKTIVETISEENFSKEISSTVQGTSSPLTFTKTLKTDATYVPETIVTKIATALIDKLDTTSESSEDLVEKKIDEYEQSLELREKSEVDLQESKSSTIFTITEKKMKVSSDVKEAVKVTTKEFSTTAATSESMKSELTLQSEECSSKSLIEKCSQIKETVYMPETATKTVLIKPKGDTKKILDASSDEGSFSTETKKESSECTTRAVDLKDSLKAGLLLSQTDDNRQVHSDQENDDDDYEESGPANKEERSKSIATIMMTSIYKPSEEVDVNKIFEEEEEYGQSHIKEIVSKSSTPERTMDSIIHETTKRSSELYQSKTEMEVLSKGQQEFEDNDRKTPPTAPVSPSIRQPSVPSEDRTSNSAKILTITSLKTTSESPKYLSERTSAEKTRTGASFTAGPADFDGEEILPDPNEFRGIEKTTALSGSTEKIITTTITTVTKVISSDGKEIVMEEKTITTTDSSDPDGEKVTVTTTRTTSESDKSDRILPKEVAMLRGEYRSSTPGSDNEDRILTTAYMSDDDIPASPRSMSSHAGYDLQRSSSGVSKRSDFDVDDSQDDIPPQYGSEEHSTARSIAAPDFSHKIIDPMSTSFYGTLPDYFEIKPAKATVPSDPIAISDKITRMHKGSSQSQLSESVENSKQTWSRQQIIDDSGDHKFLDEADLDFEKALEEHVQLRGADVMSSVTAKYSYSPSKAIEVEQTVAGATEKKFPLSDIQKTKSGETPQQATTKPETAAKSIDESKESATATVTSSTETTSTSAVQSDGVKDPLKEWGKPLGLPSPAPLPVDGDVHTTPKKERRLLATKTRLNNEKNLRKRSESPSKARKPSPVYVDLTYVPHNGNSYYSHVEFFKRVRARYYVFSGTEPSRQVYDALLEAKQTWEDKDLEVTIIPTYDTDILGYWVAENEELLAKNRIDLSPSASRCTINLQDHETSCSAYRLEF